jgi:hypothetical protein
MSLLRLVALRTSVLICIHHFFALLGISRRTANGRSSAVASICLSQLKHESALSKIVLKLTTAKKERRRRGWPVARGSQSGDVR